MKSLNKNQRIAVLAGLVFVGYLLFAGPIMDLFGPGTGGSNIETPENLVVKELVVGDGPVVLPGDTLTVHYVGTLSDGKVFDSSLDRDTPFTFTLGVGQVIRGWDEGLAGMRVGGKRQLTVPPEYGYGEEGAGTVPPNSTLIFEVELLDAEQSSSR